MFQLIPTPKTRMLKFPSTPNSLCASTPFSCQLPVCFNSRVTVCFNSRVTVCFNSRVTVCFNSRVTVCFRMNGFILSVSYSVSVLSLICISFGRYLRVCRRPTFRAFQAARRCCQVCAALWVVGTLLSLPLLFDKLLPPYGYDPGSHLCNARADRTGPGYGSIAMISMLVTPVLVIGYFNAAIFRRWHGSRRKFQKRKHSRKGCKSTWKSFVTMSLEDLPREEGGTGAAKETSLGRHNTWSGEFPSDRTSSTVCVTASDCDEKSQGIPERDPVSFRDTQLSKYRASTALMLCDAGPVVTKETEVNSTVDESVSVTTNDEGFANEVKAFSLKANSARRPNSCYMTINLDDLQVKSGKQRAIATITSCSSRRYAASMRQLKKVRDGSVKTSIKASRSPLSPILSLLATSLLDTHDETSEVCTDESQNDQNNDVSYSDDDVDSSDTDSKSRSAPYGDMCTEEMSMGTEDADGLTDSLTKSSYPTLVLAGNYTRQSRRKRKTSRKRAVASDATLVRSLLVITVSLLLFYTPFVVTLILTFFYGHSLPPALPATATLLLFVSCSVNWLIYGIMNTAFRKDCVASLRTLRCSSCRLGRPRAMSCASSLGPVTHC